MKKLILLLLSMLVSQFCFGQWKEGSVAGCQDAEFNRKVNKMLNYSVEVISVKDLKENLDDYVLLDTRELEEYLVSHIPGATHFGYDEPKFEELDNMSKDQNIVVYCSIGYRSEKIGEQLLKHGFTNVHNLYGSIFEWANCGYELEDPMHHPTQQIHTYNKRWSKWMNNQSYEKVW